MKRLYILFLFIFTLFVPALTSAAEILNQAEVLIDSQKVYSENLYIGAGRTVVEGQVLADLVIIGGEVTVNADVSGDIFLFGGQVDFRGTVAGDLRVIGGNIKVSGSVGGDLLVIGGEVIVEEGAIINQEIFAVGGKIRVNNDFANEIKVIAAEVDLNANLSGSTEITTQNLEIGSDANITGQFSYYTPQRINEESSKRISGVIRFNEIETIQDTSFVKKIIVSFISFWFLLRFITTLIIAFVLVYMFKVFSQEVANLAERSFWKSLLAGIIVLFVAPIAIIISFVSLVALPIGFLFAIALAFILIISPAMSGIFVGNWLRNYVNKTNKDVDFHSAAMGVVLLTLLQFVPAIGGLLLVILAIVSLGAISRYIRILIIK